MQQKVNKISNGHANIVFNYSNTLRKKLICNKMETGATKDVGVYKIPCKDCSRNYFGETGRALSIRHQRDYGNTSNKNVLVKQFAGKSESIGGMLLFLRR